MSYKRAAWIINSAPPFTILSLPNDQPTFLRTRRFALPDPSTNGIGDRNGVTGKLDYPQDLHVWCLWLMPIDPSSSCHEFDLTNHYGIDPEYGTMTDYKRLPTWARCWWCRT